MLSAVGVRQPELKRHQVHDHHPTTTSASTASRVTANARAWGGASRARRCPPADVPPTQACCPGRTRMELGQAQSDVVHRHDQPDHALVAEGMPIVTPRTCPPTAPDRVATVAAAGLPGRWGRQGGPDGPFRPAEPLLRGGGPAGRTACGREQPQSARSDCGPRATSWCRRYRCHRSSRAPPGRNQQLGTEPMTRIRARSETAVTLSRSA